jgi:hypothetical protein
MNVCDETIETARMILAKCAAYDPWFPQPIDATVFAWAEQIALMNLSRDDLLAGVTECYRIHGSGFHPLPADVIGAARAIRQDRAMRQPFELKPIQPANTARLEALLAAHQIGHSIPGPDERYERSTGPSPRSVACPHCHAPVGRPCYNSATRKPLGEPPHYHPTRIEAAAARNVPASGQTAVIVADRQCACGREILNDTADTCDRCQNVIDGPPKRHSRDDEDGSA